MLFTGKEELYWPIFMQHSPSLMVQLIILELLTEEMVIL